MMLNRLLLPIYMIILMLSDFSLGADPIEVLTKKDDLEEIQLKSQLEDRLARDIQAYLGGNRFIINVDVTLQKIRQVIKQKLNTNKSSENYRREQTYPRIQFPNQAKIEDEEIEANLPGLLYVEVPADKEKDAELAFMREQIKRLQNQQSQPRWNGSKEEGERDGQIERTVGVFNRIVKLRISLIVEESISQEQEGFLRNLIYQKAALNDLRGDELKIMRTEFSKLPEPVLDVKPVGIGQSWMDENFSSLVLGLLSFLALLLLVLIVMSMRKKPEESLNKSTNENFQDQPNKIVANDPVENEEVNKKYLMQKTRQEIISLGLGQPQHVQFVMDQLSAQQEKISMVASLYKVLGRSLFRSIFPNVDQIKLQNVMAQLADQPPDEEQQQRDVQDFYLLLQQRVQNTEAKQAHPFEFLSSLNDSQVLYLIQHEDVRIQALVVSQLDSGQGARVLNRVPNKAQAQVIAELGQFETFPLDTFQDVADRLAKLAQQVPSFENVNADGLSMLINMLDNMSSAEEAKVLRRLKQDKPDSFYRLRQQYFTFSDLSKTPRQILSNALREVERNNIGRALCNTPDEFKLHVLSSLTPKLKAMVREDLKRSEGRLGSKEIDHARRAIVQKLREYINTGEFSMAQLQQGKRVEPS
ncbi:MAG: FliG C-terminal domain-containing protein [Bermanella sp.]